jgi:hypothetical protein
MISHVVLLTPRADLSAAERQAFIGAFERAVKNIGAVKNVRVGRRVRIGAAYESGMPDTAEYFAMIDFDGIAGLEAYLAHPDHEALGRLFYDTLSSAFVYDYDVGGLERLRDM